jgi:hypothetical protein
MLSGRSSAAVAVRGVWVSCVEVKRRVQLGAQGLIDFNRGDIAYTALVEGRQIVGPACVAFGPSGCGTSARILTATGRTGYRNLLPQTVRTMVPLTVVKSPD